MVNSLEVNSMLNLISRSVVWVAFPGHSRVTEKHRAG